MLWQRDTPTSRKEELATTTTPIAPPPPTRHHHVLYASLYNVPVSMGRRQGSRLNSQPLAAHQSLLIVYMLLLLSFDTYYDVFPVSYISVTWRHTQNKLIRSRTSNVQPTAIVSVCLAIPCHTIPYHTIPYHVMTPQHPMLLLSLRAYRSIPTPCLNTRQG